MGIMSSPGTIMIIGVQGFLAQNLIQGAAESGYKVVALGPAPGPQGPETSQPGVSRFGDPVPGQAINSPNPPVAVHPLCPSLASSLGLGAAGLINVRRRCGLAFSGCWSVPPLVGGGVRV